MTLGEAIKQAQERRDMALRNELIRYAIQHGATYREIARMIGRAVSVVHGAAHGARRVSSLERRWPEASNEDWTLPLCEVVDHWKIRTEQVEAREQALRDVVEKIAHGFSWNNWEEGCLAANAMAKMALAVLKGLE